MPAYKVLCIDERCPTTHWLLDENFRSHAPDCENKFPQPSSTHLPTDETTTDEATTDEATTDEATTDGATTDEATTDEATTDEATTDEATTDEATTDEASTDEATTDEATTDEATTDEATTDEETTTGNERIIPPSTKSSTTDDIRKLRKLEPDTKTENPKASYSYSMPQSGSKQRRREVMRNPVDETTPASTSPPFNGPTKIAGRRVYSDTAEKLGIQGDEILLAKSHEVSSGVANSQSYKKDKFVWRTPNDEPASQIPINTAMPNTILRTPLGAAMSYRYAAFPLNSSSTLFTSPNADFTKQIKTTENKVSVGEAQVEGYDSFITGVTHHPNSIVTMASFNNSDGTELKTIPSNPSPEKNSGEYSTVLANTGISENSPAEYEYRHEMPNVAINVKSSYAATETQPLLESQSQLMWRSTSALTTEGGEPSPLNPNKTESPSQGLHYDELTHKYIHLILDLLKSWGVISKISGKGGRETVSDQQKTGKKSPIGVLPFEERYEIPEKYCRFTYLNFLWVLTLFLMYAGFTFYGLWSCFTFGKELKALRDASEYSLE